MEIVSKNEIKKLSPELADISPMAIEIKLSGIGNHKFSSRKLQEILENRAATLRLGMLM